MFIFNPLAASSELGVGSDSRGSGGVIAKFCCDHDMARSTFGCRSQIQIINVNACLPCLFSAVEYFSICSQRSQRTQGIAIAPNVNQPVKQ